MTDNTIIFHEPVRPGDVLTHPPGPALGQRARRPPSSAPAASGSSTSSTATSTTSSSASRRYTGFGYRRDDGMTTADADLAARRRARRATRCPSWRYDVTATTVVLGALASPRLAPDAPRPRLRGQPQRHPGHLPEHAQPGRLVRALRHRLDRPDGSARPHEVPHEGLGLPRRPHGLAPAPSTSVDDRRRRLRLGRRSTSPSPSATTCQDRRARVRVALPTAPDDNPWARRGDQLAP